METSPPRIVAAERVDGNVVVTFADGKSVFYPASLLQAIIPQAEELVEPDPDVN